MFECHVHSEERGSSPSRSKRKRQLNALWLGVVVFTPASQVIGNFQEPSAVRVLDDTAGAALNLPDGARPQRIDFVLTDPSVTQGIASALPSLVLAVIFAFTARSVWRILANMDTAPKGQRPFTEKDHASLNVAHIVLLGGWLLYATACVLKSFALDQGLSTTGHLMEWARGDANMLLIFATVVFSIASLSYTKGRRAQEAMEQVV